MTPAADTPGTRLRDARKARGLSQDRLAELTGIARERISKQERGYVGIGADNASRFAAVLGVPADLLLTTPENNGTRATVQQLVEGVNDLAEQVRQLQERLDALEHGQDPGG